MRALRPALCILLLLAACAEKDPVVRTIDRTVDAAEDRDAADVVQSLASTYPGRAEVAQELRRYFFGYEHLDVTVRELQSQSTPDGGWATFRVDFTGVPKKAAGLDQFLPRSATYRFALDFVVESREWKIAKAQWERER
ncbi:MAG TPA: hypothetical protein VFP80_10690 [Thermoanaerobaculia bacterium]|nr:hypothetical protein [Thermoanaerobaculia bacterium]